MNEQYSKSHLGNLYEKIYNKLCGKHPKLYPWHFQWLDARDLYAELELTLPGLGGAEKKILDVGCGDKPYKPYFGHVSEYIGIDVEAGSEVDMILSPGNSWPLDTNHFDVVLCTQVLEHVGDVHQVCKEINRVLKPGGLAVMSFPFLYNEHGAPEDYRRFTVYGASTIFPEMKIKIIKRQGAIGSTMAILLLNWWDSQLNLNFGSRILKGFLLPFTLIMTLCINIIGLLLDAGDRTNHFYNNVFMVVQKN